MICPHCKKEIPQESPKGKIGRLEHGIDLSEMKDKINKIADHIDKGG